VVGLCDAQIPHVADIVDIHYKDKSRLYRCAGRVESIERDEEGRSFAHITITKHEAVFEVRGQFHILTAGTNFTVSFGSENDCEVVDSNSSGFGVVCRMETK